MVNVSHECLVCYIFWLRTMTESTWKIQKNWTGKLVDFFCSKTVGTLNSHKVIVRVYLSRWGSGQVAGDEQRWRAVLVAVRCSHVVWELHGRCVHVVQQWSTALCWVQLLRGVVSIWTMPRVDHTQVKMSRSVFYRHFRYRDYSPRSEDV